MGILLKAAGILTVLFAVVYVVLRYLPIFSLGDPISGQDPHELKENKGKEQVGK